MFATYEREREGEGGSWCSLGYSNHGGLDLFSNSSTPVKFMEKNRMGDQTLCSAFSPG